MLSSAYGILGQQAPNWDVKEWFNLPADKLQLELSDFEGKLLYLYCFQSWCPGCHSHGFPTLQAVQAHYQDDPRVQFVVIQTVFEGFEANTLAAAKQTAARRGLTTPIGHDVPNDQRSNVMQHYQSGGTPWTVLIDLQGRVRYNAFHAQPGEMVSLMDMILDDSA